MSVSINSLESSFGKSDIQIIPWFIINEETRKRKPVQNPDDELKQVLTLALVNEQEEEILDGWSD